MNLEQIHTVSVIGSGMMGHGIAQSFAMKGYAVQLYDVEEKALASARGHIEENLKAFAAAGLIKADLIAPALKRVAITTDLAEAVKGGAFIVEAAPEMLDLKQSLFAEIESLCPAESIIATNTSSLVLRDIGNRVKRKSRLVITHWFNPPHLVPVVEVVKGDDTSEAVMDLTVALLADIGKVPVRLNREIPGFLINRIQMALVREVLDLHRQGIASAADIDLAVKGSIGFRLASIGPLLTMDLGGPRLWLSVCENLFPHICSSAGPPAALQDLAAKGHDGVKSGKGFYDYETDFTASGLDEAIKKRDREFLERLKSLYWDAAS